LSYKNIIKPILSFNPSINSFPHSKGLSDIFSNIKDIKIPQPSNLFEGNKNKKHNPTDFEAFVATNLNMVNQEIAFSNFSIGTIVSKNIFKNIGIKTGLVYSQYGGDFGNRQYNKVLYDFGITFQTTKIKAYQLDYLEWPISISTQINRKGEAQFGVISGLLLQSHNKVSIVKTGDQNSTENYDEKGYVDAYENFDFSFTLGYSHYISKRIKLKLSGKIGIVDISKNAIFKSNSYNNINSLSFGVHFQLWP
jgi:hypothetical protein